MKSAAKAQGTPGPGPAREKTRWTPLLLRAVIQARDAGVTQAALAKTYNVSPTRIGQIENKARRWLRRQEQTMKMIFIPIEPLVERYSESWYQNFPRVFREAGFDVRTIHGIALETEVKVGTFLDINSTVHYKVSQLQSIAIAFNLGKIEPGTVFFFADVEFWGLEVVRLMAQMNNIPIRICGFLHAASYTTEDAFSVAHEYQRFTELGWIACLDKIFVGSEYHRSAVFERRIKALGTPWHSTLLNKIIATGNPLFIHDYPLFNVTKEKRMLLTNRFDSEKRPGQTLAMFEVLKERFPDWEFIVTTSRRVLRSNDPKLVIQAREAARAGVIKIKEGLSKTAYHEELARAAIMVSHSIEENYGYCIAEAMIYGVVPILRRGLSHDEFLGKDSDLLFNSWEESIEIASRLMPKFGTAGWPRIYAPRNGLQQLVDEVVLLARS